jgi:hypothetical protein
VRGSLFVLRHPPKFHGAATQRQITQRNCHKTSMLLNVYVPKHIITKRSCHTTKAVIKCQMSQKVNITKRQMFQNITSQNENRHKTSKNV